MIVVAVVVVVEGVLVLVVGGSAIGIFCFGALLRCSFWISFIAIETRASAKDTLANILGLMILGSAVSKISQALADMRADGESDDKQRREIRLQLGECPHLWRWEVFGG